MKQIKKILIHFPNWLGDMLMALPLVDALKKSYPDAEIHALVKNPFHEVLLHDSRFQKVISFEKHTSLMKKIFPTKLKQQIGKERYDLAFVLTRSLSSAFVLRHVGFAIGTKRMFGTFFFNAQVRFDKQLHQRQQYLSLLTPLGVKHDELMSFLPHLDNDSTSKWLAYGLDTRKPYVIFHPGASYGSAKTWPLSYYEELASSLIQLRSIQIVFCGDKNQKVPHLQSSLLIDLTGKTGILDLVELIQKAKLIICNDSGPMHLADVLNTTSLSLFGSTNPQLTGPKNARSLVIYNKTPCGPCFKRTCPLDHSCMNEIKPQTVLSRVLEKL